MRVFISITLGIIFWTIGMMSNPCDSTGHTLVWDASEGAEHYKLYIRDAGTNEWTILSDNIKKTSIEVPAMNVADKEYEFGVKAFNRWGNHSDMSDIVTYNQAQYEPVLPPQNFRIVIDVNVNVNVNK